MQLCELIIHTHYRSFNKFFLHKFTSNETLQMATNILDESKSTSINDLQVRMYVITSFSKDYFGINSFSMCHRTPFSRATNFMKKGKSTFCGNYFCELAFLAQAATYKYDVSQSAHAIGHYIYNHG